MTPEEKALELRRRQLKARAAAAASGGAPDGMTPAQRIAAVRAGTMPPPSQDALLRAKVANANATEAMALPSGPMDIIGNFGAGTNIGMADMAGLPVDAITGAINGVGGLTGAWGPIENPVGGSEFFRQLAAPLTDMIPAPDTRGERIARRMGEEAGASTVAAPLAFASPAVRAAPGTFLAAEAASTVGSGGGAAIANEVAPDSAMAEIVGSLTGGIPSGLATSRMMGGGGTGAVIRGGIDEQRAIARDAYGTVRADQRVLPQESVDDMALGIMADMDAQRINPRLQPSSTAVMDAIVDDTARPMRIEDVENLRRMTQRSVPVTAADDDKRLAGIMRDRLTGYLDSLNDPVSDALVDGRNAHRRATAAQSVADASTKAARRAASTGSGGNEINAMRQTLRGMIDSPRKARSFKPDELAAMDAIVRGTEGQNAMRSLSRFAPTSGGLSAMLGVGGAMASPTVALPIMTSTELAKAGGERSTRKAIADLMQRLAPDRVTATRQAGVSPVIAALLAGRTMREDE